jgi:hypothetical protein
MSSIAHALATSVFGAPNSRNPGADPAASQASPPVTDGAPARPQDTVDLTETGSRNVSAASPTGKPQTHFQVAYFPPSNAPGTQTTPNIGTQNSAQTNNPTAQVASVTAAALANSSAANSRLAGAQASDLSAASQAKLQQLNEILQQLGVNPNQISFADRIALLPLVNDPAAIQQYIQGLPTQTAVVLNPATSPILAPSQATLSNPQPSPSTTAASQPSSQAPASPTSITPLPLKPQTETTGQKVNISV